MNKDEYWDLFDVNRNIVNISHIRGNKIPDGLYHLVVHVWIMNHSGDFLISQRQLGKPDELMWERTGGSVLRGESSEEGAMREVKEELGIDLSCYKPIFIKTVQREKYHDFFDSWLFVVPNDINVVIDTTEVIDYRWVSLSELREMEKNNKLVKSSCYYDEVYQIFNSLGDYDG